MGRGHWSNACDRYLDADDAASTARAAVRRANGRVAAVRAQGRHAACPCRRQAQHRQISLSADDCRSPTRSERASRSTFPSSAMASQFTFTLLIESNHFVI